VTPALTIISIIVGIVGTILERHYSKEAIERREAEERDEEIVLGDDPAIGVRLSELYNRMRIQNRKKGKHKDSP
jgi:hypothetical protein